MPGPGSIDTRVFRCPGRQYSPAADRAYRAPGGYARPRGLPPAAPATTAHPDTRLPQPAAGAPLSPRSAGERTAARTGVTRRMAYTWPFNASATRTSSGADARVLIE